MGDTGLAETADQQTAGLVGEAKMIPSGMEKLSK